MSCNQGLSQESAEMSNYPLLDLFLSIVYFFLWVLWIMLLFWILTDIFRSRDLSGWAKAGWTLGVILVPLLGVLVYLIVRGDSMHERQVREARAQDDAFRAYVRDAAGSSGNNRADELSTLTSLHDRGVLSDEEFQRAKEGVLARPTAADDVPRQTASRDANRTLYVSRLLLCRGDWVCRGIQAHRPLPTAQAFRGIITSPMPAFTTQETSSGCL